MTYENKGINYLRTKLARKRLKVLKRYDYYEMKNATRSLDITTPPQLRNVSKVLGWCTKAVDSVADRLVFSEFDNDLFNMKQIYKLNNQDILLDNAFLSALISSCSFIYISKGEDDFPRLQVIDGSNATGVLDPITNMLLEGYAVLKRDELGQPTQEAYFTTDETIVIENNDITGRMINPADYALLVPMIYKPDAKRPFGHSRITRACMDIMQGALNTLKRTDITAEFYSFPQKYVLGLDNEAEQLDTWRATVSSFLRFDKDDEGGVPTLGQFQQQSMQPHLDQLKSYASLFAGETGLTLDDLGFSTDNPASAEAIKSAHENLRLATAKAQRDFSTGILNTGFLASCVRDNTQYARYNFMDTKVIYKPIFEPDSAMLSSIGDGIIKINQSVPNYFGTDNIKYLTGIDANG